MNGRIALAVGIDYYDELNELSHCVDDAQAVKKLLDYHGTGSHEKNFSCEIIEGTKSSTVTRRRLKEAVERLFKNPMEIALFYYSGHGYVESGQGFLMTTECKNGDEGFALADLMRYANESPARHRIIIIDSCYSGCAGSFPSMGDSGFVSSGVTVLTACRSNEVSYEGESYGVFTALLIDALQGGAASLTGDITPGAIYAHIDQSLGEWEQRPMFKTCTETFVSLRRVEPPISNSDLRKIADFFPSSECVFKLDPSYEPQDEGRTSDMPRSNPEHTKVFAVLQKLNRLNLVVPVGAPHMWHAAMESKGCRLTKLGQHYRRLVVNELI